MLFQQHKLLVLNLMSSPGAGKTTLLEHTVNHLKPRIGVGVIEGDIQSSADAERILRAGARAVQINTDGACHLDSNMIKAALPSLQLEEIGVLFIENVGNLVCPAEFDLGEDSKVMMLSVTEGDDKAEKYPLMFREASLLLINKIDLLPYVSFSMDKVRKAAFQLNPHIAVLEISCQTQQGLDAWFQWITDRTKK